ADLFGVPVDATSLVLAISMEPDGLFFSWPLTSVLLLLVVDEEIPGLPGVTGSLCEIFSELTVCGLFKSPCTKDFPFCAIRFCCQGLFTNSTAPPPSKRKNRRKKIILLLSSFFCGRCSSSSFSIFCQAFSS